MERCELARQIGHAGHRYDVHVAGGSSKGHVGAAEKHKQHNGEQNEYVDKKVHHEL